MGLWLIDSDLNRYDILTGNIPGGFPVDKKRKLIDLAFSHGAKDIGDQKVGDREIKIDSFLNGQTGGFVRMLFDCGDNNPASDWSGISDDALLAVIDATFVKQGTNSLKLGVDASKAPGSDYAIWAYSGISLDLSDYANDWIYIWVYFVTLDYLIVGPSVAFQFRIGNDNTHYIGFYILKSELSIGWNLLKFDIANPDTTVGVVDWSAIDYMNFIIRQIPDNTNDFDFYVDDMKIWRVSYQAEFDDLMRQIGKEDLKFYKDTARYINVKNMRLSGHKFIIGDAKASVGITLFCPDPFFYKDSLTTESAWTVTSSPDTKDVVNEGNIDVYPVIEITASADLGTGIELKNQTDGNVLFSYVDGNFTSGTKLTVDCHNGTIDLDGTNTIRFFSGQFLRLLAGTNSFEYTGGNCSIVIKHRDRWL